jgi:hypothetical protein
VQYYDNRAGRRRSLHRREIWCLQQFSRIQHYRSPSYPQRAKSVHWLKGHRFHQAANHEYIRSLNIVVSAMSFITMQTLMGSRFTKVAAPLRRTRHRQLSRGQRMS